MLLGYKHKNFLWMKMGVCTCHETQTSEAMRVQSKFSHNIRMQNQYQVFLLFMTKIKFVFNI